MRTGALFACFALIASSVATADEMFGRSVGTGDPVRAEFDVRDTIRATPISQLGPDAFRYTEQPALGGRGYVILAQRRHQGAIVDVSWMQGHPGLGWRRTRHQRFVIDVDDYDSLSHRIDDQLERAWRDQPSDPEVIAVCADGPGSSTERIKDGHAQWMTGSCSVSHPNNVVRERMRALVLDLVGGAR